VYFQGALSVNAIVEFLELIFGNSAQVDSIQQNQQIGVYSRDQCDYFLGRGSGRLGHQAKVASSCGLSHTIDAGQ
jgi:hypothetical protein